MPVDTCAFHSFNCGGCGLQFDAAFTVIMPEEASSVGPLIYVPFYSHTTLTTLTTHSIRTQHTQLALNSTRSTVGIKVCQPPSAFLVISL
jgi:hypothetical protein